MISPFSDTLRQEDISRLSRGVLTTKEVAGILGCDPRTVRRLIESGELPAFRVRRHHRIKASDLQAYMKEKGHDHSA